MEGGRRLPLLPQSRYPVDSNLASQTIRKLDRRFLLLLVVVVIIACADRSNIGFVAQDLCRELQLTNEEYGRGVSFFYAGYLPIQFIGNAMLRHFGAPTWISFIVFSWGCIALVMGFMQTRTHFYILRALLGAAEGGSFPAMWYTISQFYPVDHVTRAYGAIASAVYFSMPVSSPIAAGLLSLGTFVSIERWRLLFFVEGSVPILFSLLLYALLPASPEKAPFLEEEEKKWITEGRGRQNGASGISFWQDAKSVFANETWRICTFCCTVAFSNFSTITFWATLLINDMLYGEKEDREEDEESCGGSETGNETIAVLVTAIPYLITGMACLLGRRYRIRNRSLFSATFYGISGMGLLAWAATPSAYSVVRFLLLTCTITSAGLCFSNVTGLAITSSEDSVRSTAAALYNVMSSLGGVVSPLVFGKLMDAAGPEVAMSASGGGYLLIALLLFSVRDPLAEDEMREKDARGSLP